MTVERWQLLPDLGDEEFAALKVSIADSRQLRDARCTQRAERSGASPSRRSGMLVLVLGSNALQVEKNDASDQHHPNPPGHDAKGVPHVV